MTPLEGTLKLRPGGDGVRCRNHIFGDDERLRLYLDSLTFGTLSVSSGAIVVTLHYSGIFMSLAKEFR